MVIFVSGFIVIAFHLFYFFYTRYLFVCLLRDLSRHERRDCFRAFFEKTMTTIHNDSSRVKEKKNRKKKKEKTVLVSDACWLLQIAVDFYEIAFLHENFVPTREILTRNFLRKRSDTSRVIVRVYTIYLFFLFFSYFFLSIYTAAILKNHHAQHFALELRRTAHRSGLGGLREKDR